jgi:hypothetical protein
MSTPSGEVGQLLDPSMPWVVTVGECLGVVPVDREGAGSFTCLWRLGVEVEPLPAVAQQVYLTLQRSMLREEFTRWLAGVDDDEKPSLGDLVDAGLVVEFPDPGLGGRLADFRLLTRGVGLGPLQDSGLWRLRAAPEGETIVHDLALWVWAWSSTHPSLESTISAVAADTERSVDKVRDALLASLPRMLRSGAALLDRAI